MSYSCVTLDNSFEAGLTGTGVEGSEGPAYLDIALTTDGYPGATDVGVTPGTVGYAWGKLTYVPGGTTEIHIGPEPVWLYYPAQFAGEIPYSFSQVYLGGDRNVVAEPFQREKMQIAIVAPPIDLWPQAQRGYSLSLSSASLSGSCSLQCALGGSIIFGLLNGVLVTISSSIEYEVTPSPGL